MKMTTGKTKFGILHIPTGLILKEYLYDYDEEDIDDPDMEVMFESRQEAELVLSVVKTRAIEKRKVKFTEKEKSFINSIWFRGSSNSKMPLLSLSSLSPSMFCKKLVNVGGTEETFEWTPQDMVNLIPKLNIVDVYIIPEGSFYRAAGISPEDEDMDEFKRQTGYPLNYQDLYLCSEFEIVEVAVNMAVTRPSTSEFRDLVFRIMNEAKVPDDIRERVKTFIKD